MLVSGTSAILTYNVCCLNLCLVGHSVDVQYSNWATSHPVSDNHSHCVIHTVNNLWYTLDCNNRQMLACQSQYSVSCAVPHTRTGRPCSGRFVKQEQWERWRAKRMLVSGSNPGKFEILYAKSCNLVHFGSGTERSLVNARRSRWMMVMVSLMAAAGKARLPIVYSSKDGTTTWYRYRYRCTASHVNYRLATSPLC